MKRARPFLATIQDVQASGVTDGDRRLGAVELDVLLHTEPRNKHLRLLITTEAAESLRDVLGQVLELSPTGDGT